MYLLISETKFHYYLSSVYNCEDRSHFRFFNRSSHIRFFVYLQSFTYVPINPLPSQRSLLTLFRYQRLCNRVYDRVYFAHEHRDKQLINESSGFVECQLLEVNSLTLVVGLVDSSLISFLLKLLQRGLTSIY